MHTATNRHIASLEHVLQEIEEEERRHAGHFDPDRLPDWARSASHDDGNGNRPGTVCLSEDYLQVNREHQITVETCRHIARQLHSGVFSDAEVLFLTERYRSVLNRIRRDHQWLEARTRQVLNQRHVG